MAGNTEHYTEGKPQTLDQLLQDALQNQPDMIYFAGYSYDAGVLLTDLPPGNLPIMGGDGLYILGGYPSSARTGFSHLHFTATAYPDEWDVLGFTAQKPHFFSEYVASYDPNNLHASYDFDRPGDTVMLSYDAIITILAACNLALTNDTQKGNLTPERLQQALTQLTGSKSVQGVSGCISLGGDGDPINKSIVMLYVDPTGHIQMESKANGHFLC